MFFRPMGAKVCPTYVLTDLATHTHSDSSAASLVRLSWWEKEGH